ncbi:hypothetical protein ZYGR_0AV00870 [Zygosaccharomyces rouxii]|uniref:Uncharacterized protein n=1 Tax=Zygosaccharomyces rouxii TaxID=4956 RepID=A0A1Q3AIB4_ZYGRO|nr:hypothetical protein ZYGR_0Z00870 [Zygosaccharomyces rouxii]GAV55456.1 hypothetical protein ZYGR_0AV00870 [Zygosaccharomyces rouxii]
MCRNYQLLKALDAPRFVYRYSRTRSTVPRLQNKLECRVLAQKYSKYLSEYNTFALFQWHSPKDLKFDKDYFWKEFAHDVSSSNQNAIFLEDKVHNEAMNNSLKSSIISPSDDTEYRCTFQTVSEPHPIEYMLRLTGKPNTKLQLHTLGLRTEGNIIASYIQSLLEESENMYKDLSYEKLLSIAKRSRSDRDKPIKELLNNLAENGITNSRIMGTEQWLVLSKA